MIVLLILFFILWIYSLTYKHPCEKCGSKEEIYKEELELDVMNTYMVGIYCKNCGNRKALR